MGLAMLDETGGGQIGLSSLPRSGQSDTMVVI